MTSHNGNGRASPVSPDRPVTYDRMSRERRQIVEYLLSDGAVNRVADVDPAQAPGARR